MNKMFLVQLATIWLIIAVVIFDFMKHNPTLTMSTKLISLSIAISLLAKFWVFKRQKDKSFMINARDLSITWSDNPNYWSWHPLPNENLSHVVVEAAVLKDICWLDVSGKFNTRNLCLGTKYEVIFVVKLEDTAYRWDLAPIQLKLVVPSGSIQEHSVDFSELPRSQWIDIPAGDFMMSKENVGEICFSLYEHEEDGWRAGLVVKGVVIRPKYHV